MNNRFKLLLIAAFFNTITWLILIPIWQYPDEQAHFAQVQGIAELGGAPKKGNDTSYEIALSEKTLGTERDKFGNNKFTYHPEFKIDYSQNNYGPFEKIIVNLDKDSRSTLVKNEATQNPPLYYFIGSIIYKTVYNSNLFSRVIAVRLFSSLTFLATIVVAFKIGQTVFDKKGMLAYILPSLVAFKPMLVYSSTGVLPDSLTNLLFAIVLLLSLLIIKNGLKLSILIKLALIIFLGVLTRQQFLISAVIAFLAILYQILQNPRYKKVFILVSLFIGVFILSVNTIAISLPIISNFRIPEFSSLALDKFSLNSFFEYLQWTLETHFAKIWPWYWGNYKWLSLTVPPIFYQLINRLVLISILGLLLKAFFIIKSRKFSPQDRLVLFLIVSSAAYFCIFILWDYFLWLKNGFSFGIQGRYYFPLVIAHLAILLVGFKQIFEIIFKSFTKYALFALVVLMVLFNNATLVYISSTYYDFTSLNSFIIQASQYKPAILKGNIIILIISLAFVSQAVYLTKLLKYVINKK